MLYTLSSTGYYKFDPDFTPIQESLLEGAKTLEEIHEWLKNFMDCFAVCKEIECGIGDLTEVEKWMKRLVKKGMVREIKHEITV